MMLALRLARRDLRGAFASFRIFLLCLALGIAAIAAVGSIRSSIETGLNREGAVILGGDAQMEFTYRYASEAERAFMAEYADAISEIVDFRSMAVVTQDGQTERGLTQVKAVDDAYPLLGEVQLAPDLPLASAFAPRNGIPGGIMHPLLADRLGLEIGDIFRLGSKDFYLSARLVTEPDSASMGFGLGPRTLVRSADLEDSGLIGPGTLFETRYRLDLPAAVDLAEIETKAVAAFRDTGMRWHDRRSGAPGIEAFVGRIGSFLVLVGLAGLAVGGIGVSAAVRSYLDGKTETIATLKTLGATRRTIFQIYFIQIGILSIIGILAGLALGASLPVIFGPILSARLPLPIETGIYLAPLLEAAVYGVLTAALFTLWPIARSADIRPATLFRDADLPSFRWPGLPYLLASGGLALALLAAAMGFASVPWLARWTFLGIVIALGVLTLAALALQVIARWFGRTRLVRGRIVQRLALGAIGGPGSEALPVVLSLGLGLSVLATIGQIDANIRGAIADELPAIAPAFFFVDIQTEQLPAFLDRTTGDPGVSRVDTAPMLRGIITRINGVPAREVAGDHWVITGDRGITYAAEPGDRTIVTKGEWWPQDYAGPPQVSFAEEEALELGLKLGDKITINILGRDLEAEITSFRVVDFSNAGIGFVLTMNPGAVAGAPHTYIATVYAEESAEAALLRDTGKAFPNITAISVREAIDQVANALRALAAATSYGAAATLITGFVVLIGAAAAGERARQFEAAILKTLGATRRQVLLSFALRAALTGAAAGLVAIMAGAGAGWAVMVYVMEDSYRFEPISALAIVLGGALVTLTAGLLFALRPLAASPARILRARE